MSKKKPTYNLPPCKNERRLYGLIARAHPNDREDMIQEAWLAHAEGKDPCRAANKYRMQETRLRSQTASLNECVDDGADFPTKSELDDPAKAIEKQSRGNVHLMEVKSVLTPKEWDALSAQKLEGLSRRMIAIKLGITERAVVERLASAKTRLSNSGVCPTGFI